VARGDTLGSVFEPGEAWEPPDAWERLNDPELLEWPPKDDVSLVRERAYAGDTILGDRNPSPGTGDTNPSLGSGDTIPGDRNPSPGTGDTIPLSGSGDTNPGDTNRTGDRNRGDTIRAGDTNPLPGAGQLTDAERELLAWLRRQE
jgi:hypothetical protein